MKLIKRNIVLMMVLMFAFAGVVFNTVNASAKEYEYTLETLTDANGNPLTVNGNVVQVKRFNVDVRENMWNEISEAIYQEKGYESADFNLEAYHDYLIDRIIAVSEKSNEDDEEGTIIKGRSYTFLYDVNKYSEKAKEKYDIEAILSKYVMIYDPTCISGEAYNSPCAGITTDGKLEVIFDKEGHNDALAETIDDEYWTVSKKELRDYAADGTFDGVYLNGLDKYGNDKDGYREQGYISYYEDGPHEYKMRNAEGVCVNSHDSAYLKVTVTGIKVNDYVTNYSTISWHKVKNNKVTFYVCPKSVGGTEGGITFQSKWFHPDKNFNYTSNPKKRVGNNWTNYRPEKNIKIKIKKVSKAYVKKHTEFIGKSGTVTLKLDDWNYVTEPTNIKFYSTEPVVVTSNRKKHSVYTYRGKGAVSYRITSSYKWLLGLQHHDVNHKCPEKYLTFLCDPIEKSETVTIKSLVSGKKIKVKVIRTH